MKITFFKIPKHRVFNYKPRYYDADKEELNERIRKIDESEKQQNNDGEYVFKRENIDFRKTAHASKRSETKLPNKRLFIYGAILLFAVALLATVRNIPYLFTGSENREKHTENTNGLEKYEWDPNTQIVIVDEDEDVDTTENTNEQ
ncbi:MAG: hypothetical protein LBS69_05970 [Prevotellaceae bacterium]|jgi:hypothetical protein|nr:hypothetical protein [Prevotellaceae bacterium]